MKETGNRNFFLQLLNPDSGVSSRRFIAILVTIHFIIASFYSLFTRTSIANMQIQAQILEYEMWIILGGFGFIGLADFGMAWKMKASATQELADQGIAEQPTTDVTIGKVENPTIQTDSVTLENTEGGENDIPVTKPKKSARKKNSSTN
jgi:hypothetical protein